MTNDQRQSPPRDASNEGSNCDSGRPHPIHATPPSLARAAGVPTRDSVSVRQRHTSHAPTSSSTIHRHACHQRASTRVHAWAMERCATVQSNGPGGGQRAEVPHGAGACLVRFSSSPRQRVRTPASPRKPLHRVPLPVCLVTQTS
jgi:hypothetical protein